MVYPAARMGEGPDGPGTVISAGSGPSLRTISRVPAGGVALKKHCNRYMTHFLTDGEI